MHVDDTLGRHSSYDVASNTEIFAGIIRRDRRDLQHPGARVSHDTITGQHRHTVLHRRQSANSFYHHTWRFGLVANVVGRIDEVNQRRARLVLGWVTVGRRVNHLGM